MNYLRSTVVFASVASLVALVAGCSTEGADAEDVTPSTEVSSKGVAPQYTPPPPSPGSVCVQDIGGTDKDAIRLQVQASRVSKFLFGGNDPFDPDPAVSDSPEYGEFGKERADLGDATCQKARDIVYVMHDKLYPSAAKCDPKTVGKDGKCPSTTPTVSIASGGVGYACYIPADSFNFSFSTQDTDWPSVEGVAELLDSCWGKGISGFIYVKKNVPPPGATCPQGKDCRPPPLVNILGTDPEPADLSDPLSGGAGATAAAVFTNTGVHTNVVLWPGVFTSGGPGSAAGTPCSTSVLAPGTRTSKQIVLNASGTQRKCI